MHAGALDHRLEALAIELLPELEAPLRKTIWPSDMFSRPLRICRIGFKPDDERASACQAKVYHGVESCAMRAMMASPCFVQSLAVQLPPRLSCSIMMAATERR